MTAPRLGSHGRAWLRGVSRRPPHGGGRVRWPPTRAVDEPKFATHTYRPKLSRAPEDSLIGGPGNRIPGDQRTAIRAPARTLDRAAAGALPVDHPHGSCRGGRLLDLHLSAGRPPSPSALGGAGVDRLHLRGDGDRAAREAVPIGWR